MKPETITQRVGVSDGELVVFDETTEGVFQGHVCDWDEMSQQMKNALISSGKTNKKGKII